MIKQTNLFRLIFSLAMLSISGSGFAQTVTVTKLTANGNLDRSTAPPLIETGLTFDYVIQYQCEAAFGQTCDNLQIVDVLPAGLVFQQLSTNYSHISTSSFDSSTNTITVNFIPLAPGATATFRITVLVPNGITADGTLFHNNVRYTSANAGSGTSATVMVEANAQPRATLFKNAPIIVDPYEVTEGEVVQITFRVGIPTITATHRRVAFNDCGTLNLENAFVSDIVPTGLEPVGPFPIITGQYTATYDTFTRELRFDLTGRVLPTICSDRLPTQILNTTLTFVVTAAAPSLINNTACVSGDPVGQLTVFDLDCHSQSFHVLPRGAQGAINKTTMPAEVATEGTSNSELGYLLKPVNASSAAGLDDFYIIDVIPSDQASVTRISPGVIGTACADVEKLEVYYQTSLIGSPPPEDVTKTSPDWQLLFSETAAAGDDCGFDGFISVPLSEGEHVTAVKWEFGAIVW